MNPEVRELLKVYELARRFDPLQASLMFTAVEETLLDSRARPYLDVSAPDDRSDMLVHLADRSVNEGEIDMWTVAPEISPIITKLARGIPKPRTESFAPDIIPAKSGFIHVPATIPDMGPAGPMELYYHALSWVVFAGGDRFPPGTHGVIIFPWAWQGLDNGIESTRRMLPIAPAVIAVGAPWYSLYAESRQPGATVWNSAHNWLPRWLISLFAWSKGESVAHTSSLPRQTKRHLSRKGVVVSDVRVVKLRRLACGDSEPSTGESTGKHVTPHWRTGHWRNQPCGPRNSLTKIIWINSMPVGHDGTEVDKKVVVKDVDRK